MRRHGLAADALFGAIAGAVATLAMGQVTSLMYATEGRAARRREDRARGGKSAPTIGAERLAGAFGADLSGRQAEVAGEALHFAMGIGAGALYGVLRRRYPAVRAGRGLGFGAAFWLVMDEIANPLTGTTPGPMAFPWEAHARGLAGHLAFGLAADAAMNVVETMRGLAPQDPRMPAYAARLEAAGGPFARRLMVG